MHFLVSGTLSPRYFRERQDPSLNFREPEPIRMIVMHAPNLTGAFGQNIGPVAAGEALVFHPDGTGGPDLVARIKIEQWPQFASSR